MEEKNASRGHLISQRTAIVTISLLLGASAAGWLVTEFFPPDFLMRRQFFVDKWGRTAVSMIEALKLYDPFHSFWFSGVLALFFVVLLLCLATRWKGMVTRAFAVKVPREPASPGEGRPGFTVPIGLAAEWESGRDALAHYGKKYGRTDELPEREAEGLVEKAGRAFRSRGYRFASRKDEGAIAFVAVSGGLRHLGNLVFHLGLLVITVGAVIGSWAGVSEILYGRPGDFLPLTEEGARLRIDDFRIMMTSRGQVSDYITWVTVFDGNGAVVDSAKIEVNHPLGYGGTRVHQSSYYIAEDEYAWARIRVSAPGSSTGYTMTLTPGAREPVPGTDVTVSAGKFLPSFRMTQAGPRSAGDRLENPALQIIVDGPGGRTAGWAFIRFPDFEAGFERIGRVVFEDVQPVYYTGLELTRNPGAPLFIAGMILGAVGLLLLYMFDFRVIHGRIDGSGVTAAAVTARWKVALESQLDSIRKEISP